MKILKLKNRGFSHQIILVAVVVAVVIAGIGYIVESNATPQQAEIQPTSAASPNQPNPETTTASTGVALRDKIRSVLRSQLGVAEDPLGSNYIPGNPYSSNSNPWCAYFASWVWQRAGVKDANGNAFPTYGYVGDIVSWAVKNHRWHPRGAVYIPQVGDLAVFHGWVHVALVDSTTQPTVWRKIRIIGGNYANMVAYQTSINGLYLDYQRNFTVEDNGTIYTIAGYVSPN